MWIKICANTSLHDARLAEELGADAVGFVFAESKRRVTVEEVAAITSELPDSIEKVGVFATTDAAEIEHAATAAALTMVQLHSPYNPHLTARLRKAFHGEIKLIQTVPYELDAEDRAAFDARFVETLRAATNDAALWAVLVDASRGKVSGGLGVPFDWQHVAEVIAPIVTGQKDAPQKHGARILIAGGLHADNVAAAIRTLQPFGVDVASGVEQAPGRKSHDRLRAFIEAALAN